MESKLRSIQEALELMLEVVRDRRLVLLEVAVAVLILAELIFTALRGSRSGVVPGCRPLRG
jgi:hypothetical protein